MSENLISETLTASTEATFVTTNNEHDTLQRSFVNNNHTYVTTDPTLIAANGFSSPFKTIVIQDQESNNSFPQVESPNLTQNSFDLSYDYDIIPVRCKYSFGELHKSKFGSGNRGKSIKVGSMWYTPKEFESMAGRSNCKDWKRSIKFAGRNIGILIRSGILQPHAVTCTCSACCDDNNASGPIRYFIPYKRRKKHEYQKGKEERKFQNSQENNHEINHNGSEEKLLTCSDSDVNFTFARVINSNEGDAQNLNTDLSATPQTSKIWWQLEQMANSLILQAHSLKTLIFQAKEECNLTFQQVFSHVMLKREENEIVQRAIEQARSSINSVAASSNIIQHISPDLKDNDITKPCANCNREASSECTGCRAVTYCSTFCQRKDWDHHQNVCGGNVNNSATTNNPVLFVQTAETLASIKQENNNHTVSQIIASATREHAK